MRSLTGLIVALLLAAQPAISQKGNSGCYPKSACKAECEETKQKIRKIQGKMRQGYGAAQGAKMEAELRSLRKLRSKLCR
ncbi:MAG: hypothetical protein WD795_20530 [Woeseia sp.]